MAKKSKKSRYEQDQSGCMWSLMSIFDFRHGRPTQKLLLDKKRGSRRIDGPAYANIKLETLSESCQICNDSNDAVQSETSAIDLGKMSVKELMEEEMCGEQDQKKHGSISGGDAKQITTDYGGHLKKNRRRTRSKMSLDIEADGFVAAKDLITEKSNHRKHKSCSSVDLNDIVEELCSRIHQKDISNLKHGVDGELAIKPIRDSFVMEKMLGEATKVLVKHFTDGKSCTKNRKIQPSKELTDALQILNSNKELFLKLLQDPNSQLVKNIRSLQDIQVEEGKFKVLTGSYLLDQDSGNGKQSSFFWRKFKGQERNASKRSDTSEDLSRIVVLKPGPLSSGNSDMASTCSSLPESPMSTGDKGQIGKLSSPFSFAEFKRKLKHAMRKEQHGVSHQPSDEQSDMAIRDKKVGGENVAMASPSRDHFFIERLPKSLAGIKKMDKRGKLKDGQIQLEHDTTLTPEQRVSNIYIEAKKHLAEIVGNSDADVDTPGTKVPKSLGRILSYSGYSSPTICSPRVEKDTRLPPAAESQSSDEKTSEVMVEINVNLPDQLKQESESEPLLSSDNLIHEEVLAAEPHVSNDNPLKTDTDKFIHESEVPAYEESQEERNPMEISLEPCSPHSFRKTEVDSPSTCSEENLYSTSSVENTCEENEQSSCLDSSTFNCSVTEKIEDLDAMSDATSRPSPISVLEPVFKEDEVSPPGMKSFTAVGPIQPRHIKFEEEISSPFGVVPSSRSCVDDDKYTFEFVKAVVQMSGLSWDEILRRSLLSDHLIEPSLIDEIDFLPDLLPCDFNLLFALITEVVENSCLSFGCMLSLATPSFQPNSKGKDVISEIWKGVNWHLKLEGSPRTLDQIVSKDFAKAGTWVDLWLDRESIGIQMQEAILDELVEDAILSCVSGDLESEILILPSAEEKESEVAEL